MDLAFNTKQTEAIKKLKEFVNQKAYNYFYLFGYAGTGKTMCIALTVLNLLENGLIDCAYVCAPTHVALNVLETYFKTNFTTDNQKLLLEKVRFFTIHKLLEFKATISNKTGSKVFKSSKESKYLKTLSNQLVIIDESSMIDKPIIKEIDKYIELYALKVIMLGDSNQLRPVLSDSKSLIFTNVPKKYPYHILLDEIMRTKSPSIKQVSKIIREWDPENKSIKLVESLLPIHKSKIKPTTFRLYHKKDDYANTTWFKYVVKKIKENCVPVILTWRNAPAEWYNKIIRQHIHKSTKDLINYHVGDCLMFSNFYASQEIADIKSTVFYTSNIIKVIEINSEKTKLIDWSLIKLGTDKTPLPIVSAYQSLLKKLNKFQTEFIVDTFMAIKMHTNPDDMNINTNSCTVKTINRAEIKSYNELLKSIKEHLEFFFEKYKSEEISSVLWKAFHKNLIDPYAQLNFGYSMTTHKAQGSTFSAVLVDFEDVTSNPNIGEMQESLYTASTRASGELGFLI
jgi:hypothetical protein